jgi:AhpD family alkylhydroperoxidase
MTKRITLKQTEPEAWKIMAGFEKYLDGSLLTKKHKELIKIRASQINGCAYCIDKHTADARKAGETERRIYTLQVWRETPFFTEEEQAILALTEEITLIQNGVSDETYNHALRVLGEKYLSQVIIAITVINAWNRFGISTKMAPHQE